MMGSGRRGVQGTLTPREPFIPEFIDCQLLHKCFRGFARTDTKPIIDILSTRSSKQRLQLLYYYKKKYNKDLFELLDSALMGDFWKLVAALMWTPEEYDAREINRVLKSLLLKDEEAVVEILCSRSNSEIESLCRKYEDLYNIPLNEDITKEISGELRHFLTDLLKRSRPEDTDIDVERAEEAARRLTEIPLLSENSDLRKLLLEENPSQLREIFSLYESLSENSIESAIEESTEKIEKEYRNALLVAVKICRNNTGYFAERLYQSMKGLGTRDRTLIRLVVSRCEIDMVQIKQEFEKKYHDTLEEFIDDDTSGDYKKMLLALVGTPVKE